MMMGVELADLQAAHGHALKLIRQTLVLFSDDHEARNWYIQVADDQNRTVLAVLFPLRRSVVHRVLQAIPRGHIVDLHV